MILGDGEYTLTLATWVTDAWTPWCAKEREIKQTKINENKYEY